MSAIEKLKADWQQQRAESFHCNRLALQDALVQDIGEEVLAQFRVEFSENGSIATLFAEGHRQINAMMQVCPDGIGWAMQYWTGEVGRGLKADREFVLVLIAAEKLFHAEYGKQEGRQ